MLYYFPLQWLSTALLLCAPVLSTAGGHKPSQLRKSYDFIVVGSGPGGGPIAANLAIAGHTVLLIEAGEDYGTNINQQVPDLYPLEIGALESRWDFFVRYHADEARHNSYEYLTWRTPNGTYHVGQNPPPGLVRLGAYYPRGGTLGGSATRNALLSVLPSQSDWSHIANITGDKNWSPTNMRRLLQRLEHVHFPLVDGPAGHGFNGYLGQTQADPAKLNFLPEFIPVMESLVKKLGSSGTVADHLRRDVNTPHPSRDSVSALYGFTQHIDAQGRRSDARTRVHTVYNARNKNGAKRYKLDIAFSTLATRIIFDQNSRGAPRAIGIEYLNGTALYGADPRYDAETAGRRGSVYASKEVIISGGTFNSPQVLKLSGIGPEEELKSFGINVVKHLPGVGTNLHDNYETSVISHAATNFSNTGPACTFGREPDPCLELWRNGEGPYISGRLGLTLLRTSASEGENDIGLWQFPGAFRGFWPARTPGSPGPELPSTAGFLMTKMNPRGSNGTVLLRSANPRDTPEIFFNFFSEAGANSRDLQALLEGTKFGQQVFDEVAAPVGPFRQEFPWNGATSGCPGGDAEMKDRIMSHVFSHHATSTCAIGSDNDPMAVLDSQLRVRGVRGLRVVDGSSFPKVPGAFPTLPIFMLSEKASDDILRQYGRRA